MSPFRSECDVATVLLALLVFSLPLTLLAPDFSIWHIIPNTEVSRYFMVRLDVDWTQLNAIVMSLLLILFCLYLEMRKRKLDEIVDEVLKASKATDAIMEIEKKKQLQAIRTCVNLLDASGEHFENLVLLKDDLYKQQHVVHKPPTIEPSSFRL